MNLSEITNIDYGKLMDTDIIEVWEIFGIKNIQGKVDKFWNNIEKAKAQIKRK